MTNARCISFRNQGGVMLHGILHEPDASVARGVCVLLLSPGTKGRVGPHRLYTKIAARLAPLGFHVLRFDFYGLGDSEGELSTRVLADMYNSIQSGRYIGDTIAAMDWMQETLGVRRFVGSGLVAARSARSQAPRSTHVSSACWALDCRRCSRVGPRTGRATSPGSRRPPCEQDISASWPARTRYCDSSPVNPATERFFEFSSIGCLNAAVRPRRRIKPAHTAADSTNPRFASAFLQCSTFRSTDDVGVQRGRPASISIRRELRA